MYTLLQAHPFVFTGGDVSVLDALLPDFRRVASWRLGHGTGTSGRAQRVRSTGAGGLWPCSFSEVSERVPHVYKPLA